MPRRIDIGTKQGMSKWVRGIARDMEREFAKNPISIPVETHGGVAPGFPAVALPGFSGEDMIVDRLSDNEYRALVRTRDLEAEGQVTFVDDFVPVLDDGRLETAIEVLQSLSSAGLLRKGLRAAADCYLTAAGKDALKIVEDRQNDRSRRRKRSSWDLLCWIDNMTDPTPGARRSLGEFGGSADFLPYTPQEVADAAGQLEEANLIVSARGLGHPHPLVQITAAGREHRDNPTAGTRSPFVKQAESTIHNHWGDGPHHHYGDGPVIHAGDHSQVAFGDHNSQHQEHNVVEQVSPGYEQLMTVLAQLLENIDSFELSEEDAAELREEIDIVRAEVVNVEPTATPDRRVVKRSVQAVKGLLAPVWNGAKTTIAAESAKGTSHLLDQLFTGGLF